MTITISIDRRELRVASLRLQRSLRSYRLRNLLTRTSPHTVHVLVRTQADATRFAALGVRVRRGDYSDRATLPAALAGIDRLLFVSSPILDPVVRAGQHRAVIDSAIDAGVDHIVYTSAMGAPTPVIPQPKSCWRRADAAIGFSATRCTPIRSSRGRSTRPGRAGSPQRATTQRS